LKVGLKGGVYGHRGRVAILFNPHPTLSRREGALEGIVVNDRSKYNTAFFATRRPSIAIFSWG